MQVLALGGAGGMGRAAVRNLVASPEVTAVVIADLDLDRAQRFAESLGSPRVAARRIDITDQAALVSAMREADLVTNTVGPYYKFAMTVAEAAIEARRNYVDLCDDYDATEDLLGLNQRAKEAGVTLLIGMGCSPGILNLLARMGASRLDQVEGIKTAWAIAGLSAIPGPRPPGGAESAAYDHMIYACRGDVPTFRDGQWVRVPSFEIGEYFDFAPPLGRLQIFHIGHPEPVTLPRFIPGLRFAANCGGLYPDEENESVRERARGHRAPEHPALPLSTPVWQPPAGTAREGRLLAGLLTAVEGTENGRKVRYTYRVTGIAGGMPGMTGTPLAVAAVMLGTGLIKEKGVLAPEACLEPGAFFQRLAEAYGRRADESYSVEDLILTQREVL